MKNVIIKFFFILSFICFSINTINAQGCSDAGFCSLTSHNESDSAATKKTKSNLDIGVVFGAAEESVTVFSQYISYSRDLTTKFSMGLKLTSAIANGSFGTRGNIGDAFLTGNYKLNSKTDYKKWSILLGAKIPFTSSNDKINEHPLPMVYQASLGTFDLITGLNLIYKKWDFNLAAQIPLTQNKNSFISEFSGTALFQTTNLFQRKPDALLRGAYTLKSQNQKFTFKPNLLFLYHFGEDSFVNNFGKRENIKGSSGVTLNANVIINYKIEVMSSIETSIAAPILFRENRPDGLTRVATLGLSYKVRF